MLRCPKCDSARTRKIKGATPLSCICLDCGEIAPTPDFQSFVVPVDERDYYPESQAQKLQKLDCDCD
jgi:hypothetical protein